MPSINENGQKLVEMLSLYKSLTPNLRPNLIPPNLNLRETHTMDTSTPMTDDMDMEKDMNIEEEEGICKEELDFLSIFYSSGKNCRVNKDIQEENVKLNKLKSLLSEERSKYILRNRSISGNRSRTKKGEKVMKKNTAAAIADTDDISFVYETDLDLQRGLILLKKIRYTNKMEQNLLSIPTIINISANPNTPSPFTPTIANTTTNSTSDNSSSNNQDINDIGLYIQHFLGINGHDVDDITTFQQIYSLAYSIRACIAHLPIRFAVCSLSRADKSQNDNKYELADKTEEEDEEDNEHRSHILVLPLNKEEKDTAQCVDIIKSLFLL